MDTTADTKQNKFQVDLTLLDAGELALLQKHTGIQDTEQLAKHVQDVVEKARQVFGYGYLTQLLFLKSKFTHLPAYKHVLEIGKSREDALLLDIGCGLGHDTRRAAWDGYPLKNIVASDLYPEFWTVGHEMFKSTPETFPVPFIPGDAFDNDFIPDREPFMESPNTPRPSTDSLVLSKSLAGLQGHITFIHASALFHLFGEDAQRNLAKKLASLVSPVPGSMIFGIHRGSDDVKPEEKMDSRGEKRFYHSVESWKRLWMGGEGQEGVFPPGTVEVEVGVRQLPMPEGMYHLLLWSVKRV
ncbi:hypothetical protein K435DRAFT_748699 [Dendrothele bispora CBS 962.96]|uniref:Methyltransferase domain-containing protein n=1 Tax=Dendrothele bispora (strain CBS 962.96) TaxID=1314807 RepID=A0A4S8MJK9_DENBC|nr:hypothetical protein K435DRAFT_748699 [Dendrothele bispora CBS 962.96]